MYIYSVQKSMFLRLLSLLKEYSFILGLLHPSPDGLILIIEVTCIFPLFWHPLKFCFLSEDLPCPGMDVTFFLKITFWDDAFLLGEFFL